ncbi:MAG: hypothetical protein AB8H86_13245 [Polyangiales bacterium]
MNTLLKSFAMMAVLSSTGCIIETDPIGPVPVRADTYEECSFDSDCFSSDYCENLSSSTVDTAICTQACFNNRDCPTTNAGFEGVCLPYGTYDACVESCRDNFDCPTGFNCEVESLTGFDYLICVPR